MPSPLVHSVLQATVQLWQPMHLLRSMTIEICLPMRLNPRSR